MTIDGEPPTATQVADASPAKSVATTAAGGVRYLGPDGKRREVSLVVLEGGRELWDQWTPTKEEVEGWEK